MENTATQENKMGVMPIPKLLITMSLPIVLSMLVQALYNIVDSIFVAQINENALTAVSLAFPVQNLMIAISAGTGVGINALLSRNLGEKKYEDANLAARNGIFLAIVSSIIMALIGIFGSRPFFLMQTKDPQIVSYGTQYMTIITVVSIGIFMQITFERLLQATGRTIYTMITQGLGAIINIILDPILIFGLLGFPGMGVKGAAVATVIGQISAFLLYIVVYLRKNPGVTIHPKYLHLDWQLIRQIYSVGIPSSLMMTMPSVLVGGLNGILAAFSDTYVAVLGIYFKLQTFIYMPANGIVQGMRPIIGYNYGAGSKKRVRDTIRYSLISAAVLMLVGTVVSLAIPDIILSMFQADAELMRAGTEALRLISLGFLVSSAGVIFSGVFEALGRGGDSLIISLLRQLVIILPLGYLLSRTMGAAGIWISFPVAELVSAVIACLLLKRMEGGIYFPFDKKEIINRK